MKKRSLLSRIVLSAVSATLLLSAAPAAHAEEQPNAEPHVIPAVREWTGGHGQYVPGEGMKIVLAEGTSLSEEKKNILVGYFDNLFDITVEVVSGETADGDILLAFVSDESLGEDGYVLTAETDGVTVQANGETGLLYGVITVLQSCVADGYMPVGTARDYSAYTVRGTMLDVARAWIPMDYLTEIGKYLAWFKINEFHVHVSDNQSFRLESDIEGLATEGAHYTKDEYRAFQKLMAEYGIEVITEIDTPAHAACFSDVVPEYMYDGSHIDIYNPEAVQFVKDLLAEYLTGDDPVIVSEHFHIGTDEYPAGHEEQMRAYTDELLRYVKSLGYTPRFWGAFGGTGGFNGETPVTSDAEANFWAYGLSDCQTLLDMGYELVNTYGPILYIVPGGNYGFADYYDLEKLYSSWQVYTMDYSTTISPDHEQLLGASSALWNDLHGEGYGFTYFDIFDRLRGQVCLMAEKTWCGSQTEGRDASEFVARYEKLSLYAGDADPGRHTAQTVDTEVTDGAKSFGWPYVASMDLTVNSLASDTTLFGGEEGQFYIASDGRLGFRREDYDFKYEYRIKEGETVGLQIIGTNQETVLVVDGTYYYEPQNSKRSETMSSTFVLPLEQIGADLDGRIENLHIESKTVDLNLLTEERNLAKGCAATVSGLEVNDGRFTPNLALDEDSNTRLSFARDTDEQWLLVDLGEVHRINLVEIEFYEHISDYSISVSVDGENFTEVAHVQKGEDQAKQTDTVEFDMTEARYVRYEQHKRFYIADWDAYYSGGITEFRVYGIDRSYKTLLEEADSAIDKNAPDSLRDAYRALYLYTREDRKFTTHLQALVNDLQTELDAYRQTVAIEGGESSATENDGSETVSSSAENGKKGISPAVWACGIAAAVGIAAVAVLVWKKKKKK